MKKQGILLNAKMGAKVARRKIFGSEHIVVEGSGSIVADTVMNGIYYPREEVMKLASETTGIIHAPASHPMDAQGNFISAGSPEGIHQGYIGAISYNYRMDGDRLVRDIAIDPVKAAGSELGKEVLSRIENQADTDTSTGLLLYIDEESGVGKDGEPYDYVARNMSLDHDAILLEERGAATTLQGVGMFANSKGEKEELDFNEVDAIVGNALMPALRLPVAPAETEYNEAEAINRIREYTNSEDAPSSNYRRFFLNFDREDVGNFEAYKFPFADIINGKPYAVKKAIDNAKAGMGDVITNEGDKSKAMSAINEYESKFETNELPAANSEQEDGLFKRLLNRLFESVAGDQVTVYNEADKRAITLNNDEEDAMGELILAALNEAGVKTDGLSETELLAAYNKLGTQKPTEEKGAEAAVNTDAVANAVATAVANAVKPLQEKLDAIETAANAAEEEAKADLVKQAVDLGIEETDAKTMSANSLKSLVTKMSGSVAFNAFGGQMSIGNKDEAAELPSFDA
jgi:hypothetical protein